MEPKPDQLPTPAADVAAKNGCDYSGCTREAYGVHSGKSFCVLHLPSQDKQANFRNAVEMMLKNGNGNFRGAWFPEAADFQGWNFPNSSDFSHAVFNGPVDFSYCEFREPAVFQRTQ